MAWQFFAKGYNQDLEKIINNAIFNEDAKDMVIVRDIEFFSLCEHHLIPFFGRAHVGYLPNGKVVGLSKIPRIIDMFSRRLQVQERLTRQIAETVKDILDPVGVAVIMEGQHMCACKCEVLKNKIVGPQHHQCLENLENLIELGLNFYQLLV